MARPPLQRLQFVKLLSHLEGEGLNPENCQTWSLKTISYVCVFQDATTKTQRRDYSYDRKGARPHLNLTDSEAFTPWFHSYSKCRVLGSCTFMLRLQKPVEIRYCVTDLSPRSHYMKLGMRNQSFRGDSEMLKMPGPLDIL